MKKSIYNKQNFLILIAILFLVFNCSCSSSEKDTIKQPGIESGDKTKKARRKFEAQKFIILKYDFENSREELITYTIYETGIKLINSFFIEDVHFTYRSPRFIDSNENLCFFHSYCDFDVLYIFLVRANINTGKVKFFPLYDGEMGLNCMASLTRNPKIILSPYMKKYAFQKMCKADPPYITEEMWKEIKKNGIIGRNIYSSFENKPYHVLDTNWGLIRNDNKFRFTEEEMKKIIKQNQPEDTNPGNKIPKNIKKLLSDGEVQESKISPDNRYLMFINQVSGLNYLRIINLENGKNYFIPLGFNDSRDYECSWVNPGTSTIIDNNPGEHRSRYYYDEILKYYGHVFFPDLQYEFYQRYKDKDIFFRFPYSFIFHWDPGYKRLQKIYLIGKQDRDWTHRQGAMYYREFYLRPVYTRKFKRLYSTLWKKLRETISK